MIAYIDSSVLVRAYLADEPDHDDVRHLLEDPDLALISSTLTPIEVSGALVRAARAGRGREEHLLSLLDNDIVGDGPVTIIATPPEQVEETAMMLVRQHGLRALDAWHLSAADRLLPELVEPGEAVGFASRDKAQASVAEALGFEVI